MNPDNENLGLGLIVSEVFVIFTIVSNYLYFFYLEFENLLIL